MLTREKSREYFYASPCKVKPRFYLLTNVIVIKSSSNGIAVKGSLIEFGPTNRLFTKPEKKQTEDYITGRFA